jgi:hypothetical protein
MESDIHGCSTCSIGEESWEEFKSSLFKNRTMIQYDYRHTNGKLFSCIAANLKAARQRRDEWLKSNKL